MREHAQAIQPSVNKVINRFADRFVHGFSCLSYMIVPLASCPVGDLSLELLLFNWLWDGFLILEIQSDASYSLILFQDTSSHQ